MYYYSLVIVLYKKGLTILICFLYQSRLKIDTKHIRESMQSCGATLLSPTHALSAAHCFKRCDCSESIDDINCPYCMFYGVDNYTLFAGSTVANYSVVKSKLNNYYIQNTNL